MNIKAKKAKVQPLSKKSVMNVLSQDELRKKVQVIEQDLNVYSGDIEPSARGFRATLTDE